MLEGPTHETYRPCHPTATQPLHIPPRPPDPQERSARTCRVNKRAWTTGPRAAGTWASHPQVAVALPGRAPAGTEPRPSLAAGQTPSSNAGRGPAPRAPPHQLLKHEVGATSAPGPRARHPQEPGSKGPSSPCSSTRVPWSLGELSQQMAAGSATLLDRAQ